MPEQNPYDPPEARLDRPAGPRRRIPRAILVRAAAVVVGFSLLANPTYPAFLLGGHNRQVAARVLGAALLLAAFFSPGRRHQEDQDL